MRVLCYASTARMTWDMIGVSRRRSLGFPVAADGLMDRLPSDTLSQSLGYSTLKPPRVFRFPSYPGFALHGFVLQDSLEEASAARLRHDLDGQGRVDGKIFDGHQRQARIAHQSDVTGSPC